MARKLGKPKMGRPPLPPDKRRGASIGIRLTPENRERLEKAAEANGRSMSQELSARLEQSFLEEDALGGRQLRSMFGLLANAAVLIEEQTGKSCFEDHYTWAAVHTAWKRLIAAFAPPLPEGLIAAFEEEKSVPVPKFPIPPMAPLGLQGFFGQGSEQETRQYEEKLKEYEAARKRYEKESIEYEKAGEAARRFMDELKAQIDWGSGIGISLLPEKPKKAS